MSNAPIVKDVVRPLKQVTGFGGAAAQYLNAKAAEAATEKQKEGIAATESRQRRAVTAAAAEKSAAARARRGRGGYRSLLARERGGLGGDQLARTLGGIE
jgi:hypothetical protein